MLVLFLLITGFAEMKEEIRLDNRGMFLNKLNYNRVFLENDGTFLLASLYHAWHWDQEGRLINRIGGKGEGPGEFLNMGQVLWTGDYYWLIDAKNLKSSVYDAQGNYLFRKNMYFRQFVRAEDELFLVDLSQYRYEARNKPRTLHQIQYEINDRSLKVSRTGLAFKKVTERQFDYHLNFKLCWVVPENGGYLVMDQLEPKIWVYNQKVIDRESKVSDQDFFEPPSIGLQLSGWVDPPETFMTRSGNTRRFREWWMDWSRVNYFARCGDGLLIAYETPDENDPRESLQVIQKLDMQGKRIGDPLVLDGIIAGTRDGNAYVLIEGDDPDYFEYFIRVYSF